MRGRGLFIYGSVGSIGIAFLIGLMMKTVRTGTKSYLLGCLAKGKCVAAWVAIMLSLGDNDHD
jgi:hypothetical protein